MQKTFGRRCRSGAWTTPGPQYLSLSAVLTETPNAFDATHIAQLRDVGLDDADIVDVINGGAFSNWANRLMLRDGASYQDPTTQQSDANLVEAA